MPKTLQQAAQEALDVQDACNLSGVLHSLDTIVREVLWPEATRLGVGTRWINHHPIVSMFLDKLESLNGIQVISHNSTLEAAISAVEGLASGAEDKTCIPQGVA